MAVVSFFVALIILGFFYLRMVRREIPDPIGKAQAIVPILLGAVSIVLAVALSLGLSALLVAVGLSISSLSIVIKSLLGAFIGAGLPEEAVRLLMILIALRIFRSKVRNVYEFILIGAATGFGFTLLEEAAYATTIVVSAARLVMVGAHMIFGMIMAKHIAIGRYNKKMGVGPVKSEYAKAIIIPVIIHTIIDSVTGFNGAFDSSNDNISAIGIVIALIVVALFFVLQIVALVRFKKNTEKYCGMLFRPADDKLTEE